jgi:hypothetical protein
MKPDIVAPVDTIKAKKPTNSAMLIEGDEELWRRECLSSGIYGLAVL